MQATDATKRKRDNDPRDDSSARYDQKLDAMIAFKLPQARKAELAASREARNAVLQDKFAQAKKREEAGARAPASKGAGFQQEFLNFYQKQLSQKHQA